jgi:hypothetical protein
MSIEEAIAYWHRRYETEPEPLKSFAREHLKGLFSLQDEGSHIHDWCKHIYCRICQKGVCPCPLR